MDALSILALGVAQAGGGGGGGTSDYSDLSNKPQINSVTLSGNKSLSDLGIPTYTAGDNVTISNNEISVEGLELEKEDSFVQDAVDKTNVSGGNVSLSQKVNGNYSKGLYLNSDATINGDDQTASNMFGLSTKKLWFEDYNLDRTVRLEPTSDYRNLAINGVPIGGGSSAGAVRYDQAQSLTDEQNNQAKANQELPYISYTRVNTFTNYSQSIATSASGDYIYPTFSVPVSLKTPTLYLSGTSSNNISLNATITMTSNTGGTLVPDGDEYSTAYFNTSNPVYINSANRQMRI